MNLDKLLASNMFAGAYSYPSQREKPWHGFLYLARSGDNIKVGYTNYDIGRRSEELKREDIDAVFYSWSSPNPQVLEKYVKEKLREFSLADESKYQYEIFEDVPWTIMVYTIRLIILWVHLKEKWVIDENDYYKKLAKYFDGVSFNIIEFQGRLYEGKDVPEPTIYKKGTRVLGYWDKKEDDESEFENGWYEAKIIKYEKRQPKDSPPRTKKEPSYQIEWEVTSGRVWLLADRVKPLYPEVDVKRTLRLEDAYEDLGINIEIVDRLKF